MTTRDPDPDMTPGGIDDASEPLKARIEQLERERDEWSAKACESEMRVVGTKMHLGCEITALRGEMETLGHIASSLRARLAAAEERSKMLSDAKNHWADRARAAEEDKISLARRLELAQQAREKHHAGDRAATERESLAIGELAAMKVYAKKQGERLAAAEAERDALKKAMRKLACGACEAGSVTACMTIAQAALRGEGA
jgi:chromosome segregation ATPase